MKISELLNESAQHFDPVLIQFWEHHHKNLSRYFRSGETGCVEAAEDLANTIGGFAEVVPIGSFAGKKKVGGWIHTDTVQTDLDSFTADEIAVMRKHGLNPNNEHDRAKFIHDNGLQEEFKWVPHSWVEVRGRVFDPSGFYIDGQSGQFDRMVHNKTNLAHRYHYF
jgi:hypothetical protein